MMVTAKLMRDGDFVLSMVGDVSETGDINRLVHELTATLQLPSGALRRTERMITTGVYILK